MSVEGVKHTSTFRDRRTQKMPSISPSDPVGKNYRGDNVTKALELVGQLVVSLKSSFNDQQ